MKKKLNVEYKLEGFKERDWLDVLNADRRREKAKYYDLLKSQEKIFDKDGYLYGYDRNRERERTKKEAQ